MGRFLVESNGPLMFPSSSWGIIRLHTDNELSFMEVPYKFLVGWVGLAGQSLVLSIIMSLQTCVEVELDYDN